MRTPIRPVRNRLILSAIGSTILGLLTVTLSYTAPPVQASALSVTPEEQVTVLSLISKISEEYDISSTTLYNLAWSESGLDPDPPGPNDGGEAAGIMQIHWKLWGLTKEQALDPEFSLRFAAEHIKNDTAYLYWSPCSCVTFARTLNHHVPHIDAKWVSTFPHATPALGRIAVFSYSSTFHIGYITEMSEGGFYIKEGNYRPCLTDSRFISWNDPHLVSFWDGGT